MTEVRIFFKVYTLEILQYPKGIKKIELADFVLVGNKGK